MRWAAVWAIARFWQEDPNPLPWLKDQIQEDDDGPVRGMAVLAIASFWKEDPETLPMLKNRIQQDDDGGVRRTAVEALARGWKNDPDVIQLLLQVASQDPFEREEKWQENARQIAIQALVRQDPHRPTNS